MSYIFVKNMWYVLYILLLHGNLSQAITQWFKHNIIINTDDIFIHTNNDARDKIGVNEL